MGKHLLIFCDRFHWLWLALASPFMLFPSPTRSLAMLVVPGLFLLRWLAIKEQKRASLQKSSTIIKVQQSVVACTPFNLALLLMILMVLVSIWATFDINLSLPKISGIILGLGIFQVIVREGQTRRAWWLCFLFFMVTGLGIAVIGLLGTHWFTKIAILTPIVSRLTPRIIGLPGAEEGFHPNTVAGALVWVIPCYLTFSWILLTKTRDIQGFLGRGKANVVSALTIGATLWILAILILTQSRDGYISLALSLPVLFLIALPRKRRWHGIVFLALFIIIVGVLLASHWGTVRPWIIDNILKSSTGLSMDSFNDRLQVWSRAIYGISDFPFTGMGMNTFRKIMPVLYPVLNISPEKDIGHAHNEFLQAALDLGIPGLVAFIAIYLIAFWMLIRIWRRALALDKFLSNEQTKRIPLIIHGRNFGENADLSLANSRLVQAAVLGLGGGLLAHLLWGMTDAMALGSRPGFLFWIILALITGLHQQVFGNVDGQDESSSLSEAKETVSK